MRIEGNRVTGDGTRWRESPNQGGPFAPGELDTIVLHYTAGANAESAIETLSDPERQVSAHLVVARDGQVTQLVPFDRIGWHAGMSRWGLREGFNRYSLGIEVDNAGQLTYRDGVYTSWFGQLYPESEVVWAVHRNQVRPTPWHRYPREQLRVVEVLCRLLIEAYGIRHILGHEEIAPERKVDPGPAFPLDSLRGRLLTGPAAANRRVRSGRAILRAVPGPRAPRVAASIRQGTPVHLVEEQEGWCRVEVVLDGWMLSRELEDRTRS
jgi:N-acetylmuramoyl-L-alanine amidase